MKLRSLFFLNPSDIIIKKANVSDCCGGFTVQLAEEACLRVSMLVLVLNTLLNMISSQVVGKGCVSRLCLHLSPEHCIINISNTDIVIQIISQVFTPDLRTHRTLQPYSPLSFIVSLFTVIFCFSWRQNF